MAPMWDDLHFNVFFSLCLVYKLIEKKKYTALNTQHLENTYLDTDQTDLVIGLLSVFLPSIYFILRNKVPSKTYLSDNLFGRYE